MAIKKVMQLSCWILSLLVISSVIGNMTNSSVDTWYAGLNLSPLTPPNYVFGIIWSILYVMIAVSGWLIWNSIPSQEMKAIKQLFSIQLLLNWSWTPLFFSYHLTGIALVCLISMIIFIAALIKKTYQHLTAAALLLVPYWLWLLFASYLNLYIWYYN